MANSRGDRRGDRSRSDDRRDRLLVYSPHPTGDGPAIGDRHIVRPY